MQLIRGRWKAGILYLLGPSDRRFGELQRALPQVAHKVLIERLRELEHDGLVERAVVAGGPRHVRYSLSDTGRSLLATLELLRDWSAHGVGPTPPPLSPATSGVAERDPRRA